MTAVIRNINFVTYDGIQWIDFDILSPFINYSKTINVTEILEVSIVLLLLLSNATWEAKPHIGFKARGARYS